MDITATAQLAEALTKRATELRAGDTPEDISTARALEEHAAVLRQSVAAGLDLCQVCGVYPSGLTLCRHSACPYPDLRKEPKT